MQEYQFFSINNGLKCLIRRYSESVICLHYLVLMSSKRGRKLCTFVITIGLGVLIKKSKMSLIALFFCFLGKIIIRLVYSGLLLKNKNTLKTNMYNIVPSAVAFMFHFVNSV